MAVSKETGKVFYPRQNREWDEDYLIIKKIYDEKLVGNVFNIKCRIMGSRGIPGDWRGVKAYGGGMIASTLTVNGSVSDNTAEAPTVYGGGAYVRDRFIVNGTVTGVEEPGTL